MRRASRLHAAWISAAALTAVVAGCGDDKEYRNTDRPPAPITVTAYIGKDKVSISPSRVGGGPLTVVATNQTGRSQQLTLETADVPGSDSPGVRQRTGPINPQDTARIRATVEKGSYTVSVGGDAIEPATLEVGDERETSQQDLMLP
ncbi:MAG TPA: hypothetical protein VFR97_03195 [Capillimicrobium sp.]|nr:hypothetical protein [Capillimicrobium sp.]